MSESTLKLGIQTNKILPIFNMLSAINDEVHFTVKDDGLHFFMMDSSHICMMQTIIPKFEFSKYEIGGDMTIGFMIDDAVKMLRRMKGDSILTISISEGLLKVENDVKSFSMRLLSAQAMTPPTLNIKFACSIETKTDTFSSVLDDTTIVSSDIKFIGNDKLITYEASGDSGKCSGVITESVCVITDDYTDFTAIFLSDYLKKIITVMPKNNDMRIELAEGKPIHIILPLSYAVVNYWLAPKAT